MRTSRAQVPLLYHPRLAGKQTRFPCASSRRAIIGRKTQTGGFLIKSSHSFGEKIFYEEHLREIHGEVGDTPAQTDGEIMGFPAGWPAETPPRGPPDKSRFGAALIKTATRVWLLNTRKRDHFFGGERKNKRCRLLEAGRNGVFRVDRSSLNWNCI